ncbi:Serine/threonine protein kinase PrkC, regulator of stationary phase [Labilithrix luteola]|uniref:Serine/threonine protein kinase PrkC, regulator of stationary phase n=1 Tax=Labilithrix luteola TaxID=1391654 RepID=A0A0K1PPC0_9BACT|nr:Serine/threonine protein kinase PrkC, regulator of stationary phase [Labilithrix luteola]
MQAGDILAGKYRVERMLGSGGMGYVVAARHIHLDQLVAMKFLQRNSGTSDDSEASGRFMREAKAVVRLHNEHVARVYDVGRLETGEQYIVMEYLEGHDLATMSKERGQLPIGEAVEYMLQACEALAEAHSIGIVHRDVKLANLFVSRGPTGMPLLKVLDFGISKVNPFGEGVQDMTRTAAMLGSPRFMSPEQMRDPRTVDARSDIWSLGVVLYRLVAAAAPFDAETLGRLFAAVMQEAPPPLSALVPNLPPGFEAAVLRCLEKERDHRYANVAEFADAILPYALDPIRAEATVDRIRAVLSMPAIPRSQRATSPSFPSASIPGVLGTGDISTAPPWAGTQNGTGPNPSIRSSITWGVIALLTLGAVTGAALKLHAGRTTAANASMHDGVSVVAVETALPAAATAPIPPAPVSAAAETTNEPPVEKTDANGASGVNGASGASGASGAITVKAPARVVASPAATGARKSGRNPAAANGNSAKAQDEIPSTRD